jgi:hypothetical protein
VHFAALNEEASGPVLTLWKADPVEGTQQQPEGNHVEVEGISTGPINLKGYDF